MTLSYAVLFERLTICLREAHQIHHDAPTAEHAALLKEIGDPLDHLERLIMNRRGGHVGGCVNLPRPQASAFVPE